MNIFFRICVFIISSLIAFVAPWWFSAAVIAAMIVIFAFPELLLSAFILDMLYSSRGQYIFHIPLIFSLSSFLLLSIFIFLRTKMKFY